MENTSTQAKLGKVKIAIAMIIGVAIGGLLFFDYQGEKGISDDVALNATIENYILNNPDVIIAAVQQYQEDQYTQSQQIAANLVSANDGDTVMGNPQGDVTIYEFSDYNCGYCKRVFASLLEVLADDPQIRLVVKEYPILAPSSLLAAQVSIAAAQLGKYPQVHSGLMQVRGRLDEQVINNVLNAAGITRQEVDEIIQNGSVDTIIEENQHIAQTLGINGTPAFMIGEQIIPGAISAEEIKQLIKIARES